LPGLALPRENALAYGAKHSYLTQWLTASNNQIIILNIIRFRRIFIMRVRDYLSATDLSKKTSATLEALEKGETEKLIILKNNAPKAVLLSMEAYEALEEELEDLRLTALALARSESFEESKAVSHESMMENFGS
jgi:antitoxin StbD